MSHLLQFGGGGDGEFAVRVRGRKYAGEGTDHLGIGRCKYHLGATRNHKVHAITQEARRRAIEFGQPLDVTPAEALLATVHLSAGHLQFIRDELAAHGERLSFEAQVLARQYDEERDRLARTSKLALDAGLQERLVLMAERYGATLAEVMRAVFYDPELGLSPMQQATLPNLLRRHLQAAEGPPALARTRG